MSWRVLLLVCLALAAAVSVDSLRLRVAGSQRRTSAAHSADSVIEDMIDDAQGAEALLELEALAETDVDSEYSKMAGRRPPPRSSSSARGSTSRAPPSRSTAGNKAPKASTKPTTSKKTTASKPASSATAPRPTASRPSPTAARTPSAAARTPTAAARSPNTPASGASKPVTPAAPSAATAQKASPAAAQKTASKAPAKKTGADADDAEDKPRPKPKTATQLRSEARMAALKASRKAFNDALNKIPIRQKRAKVKLDLIRIRKAQETLAKNVLWHREHVQKTAYLAKEQNRKAFEARMASVDEKRIVALKMQLVDNQANLTTTINTLVGLRHRRDELLAQANEEALKHKDTESKFHNKEAQEIIAKTQELEPQQASLDITVAKVKKELDALNADYKDEQKHKSSARKYAKEKVDESKSKAKHRAELSKRAALKAIGQIKRKAFKTAQTAAAIDGRVFQGKDDGQKELDLAEKPVTPPPEAPTPPPAYSKYPEQQANTLIANVTAVEQAVANLTGEAREEGMQKAIVSEHKKAMIKKLRLAIAKYREEQVAKKKLVAAEQASKEADEKSYLRQSQEQGRKRNTTEYRGLDDAKSREKIALEAKTQFEKARQIRDAAEATAKTEAVAEEQSAKKRYASAADQSMKQKALDMATSTYKKAAAAAAKSPNPRTTKAAEDARLAMVEAMRQAEQAAAAQAADAAAAQSAKVKADEAQFKAKQAIAAVDKVAKDKDVADMAASKAQQQYEQTKIERKKADAQAEVDMQNEAQQKLKAKSDAFAANKQREDAAAAKLKEWAEAIISSDDSAVGRKFQLDMGLANPADMPTPSAKMFIELESRLPTHQHLRFKRAPKASKASAPKASAPKASTPKPSTPKASKPSTPKASAPKAPAPTTSGSSDSDDGPKMPESVKAVMDQLAKQVTWPNAATAKAAISKDLLNDAVGDLTGLEGPALAEAVAKMTALSPVALKGAVDILAHNMMQDEKDAEKLYAAAEPESSESAAKPKDDPELDAEDEAEDAANMGPTGDRKLSLDKLADPSADVSSDAPEGDEASEEVASGDSDEDVDPALSESSLMSESMDPEDAKDSILGDDTADSIDASPLSPGSSGLPGGDAPRAGGPSVEINVVNHNVLNARSAPGAQNVQLPASVVNSGLMPSELQAIGDPDAYIKKLSQAALGAQANPNPVADQAVALTKLVASMVGSQLNNVPEVLPSAQPPAPAAPAAPASTDPQAGLTAAPNSAIAGVTPVRFRE